MRRPRASETEPTIKRRTAAEVGQLGERLASDHLAAAGYRCLARNLRTRHGEIDLLVRRGHLLVAVEVKTRRRDPAPEAAVDDRRLARLRAALIGVAPRLRRRPRALRVDIVAVRLPPNQPVEVRHFPGIDFEPHIGRWR